MSNNIIGIHTFSVSTEMTDFAKYGIYRTVPAVLYKVNDNFIQCFIIKRPIEIFKENMDYGRLRNIVHGDDEFFAIPGKAYWQMRNYVNQNVNKVIADMITHIIVKVIHELKEEDADARNVFFIDSVDSNKIIGRLGYLYLQSDDNTIAFVTYKAAGLLSDTLNYGNEKVLFDINYFRRQESVGKSHSPVVPNDYMESLTQAVFYNLSTQEAQISPLRCDILSQGISGNQIEKKVAAIADILADPDNITPPYPEQSNQGPGNNLVRIPQILYDCIDAEKIFINEAQSILEDNAYA